MYHVSNRNGRRTCRRGLLVAAFAAAAAAATLPADRADAVVVYQENFTNTTASGQPMSYAGWKANRGAVASAQTDDGLIYPNIANANGDAPEPSVGSNPAEADNVKGYVYSWGGPFDVRYSPYLLWTDEFSVNPADYQSLTFSTNTHVGGNTSLTDAMRIAVRVGPDWFVTDATVQPTATTWGDSFTTGLVSASLSDPWRSLTFTPGSVPFAVGDVTPLPGSGNIEAFGVFADSKSVNIRFGGYRIDGVALPSLTGDTNDDGVVDLTDLNNVLNNFGAGGAGNPGDDDGNQVVDLTDLNNVLNNFGSTGAAAAALSVVPEPASTAVGLFGLGAAATWRRRRSPQS